MSQTKSMAYAELERIQDLSAFNMRYNPVRRRLNQHATRYTFSDDSVLTLFLSSGFGTAKNKGEEVYLKLRIRVNKSGI